MIQGTTDSTFVSGSVPTEDESTVEYDLVLATEKDEDAKEAETEGNAGGGTDAFWVGWVASFFFLA